MIGGGGSITTVVVCACETDMTERLTLVAVNEGSLLDPEEIHKVVAENDDQEQEYHDMVDDLYYCGYSFHVSQNRK